MVMKKYVFRAGKNKRFNCDATFGCGQAFRWERANNGRWFGQVLGQLLEVEASGDRLVVLSSGSGISGNTISNYLSLDDDTERIFDGIFGFLKQSEERKFSDILHKAYAEYDGLRLLSQPFFETAASYILSRNNSILSISRIIYHLSRHLSSAPPSTLKDYRSFAENLSVNYAFPEPEDFLSPRFDSFCLNSKVRLRYPNNQKSELRALARKAFDEPGWGLSLRNRYRAFPLPVEELCAQRKRLLEVKGIGNKVCDCVMLFGLGHLNSFPIDRWVLRVMAAYSRSLAIKKISSACMEKKHITDREYLDIIRYANEVFGPYAGYAGEYLFFYKRLRG